MGKKKAITNEELERRCWEDLAIAVILQALNDYTALDKDAFLFLNSSWFKLLNPSKYTGNELIRMARRFKNDRKCHRFIDSLARVIKGGTNNDQNR